MTLSLAERHRLAILGWVATVATSLSLFTAFEEKRYVIIGAALSALVVGIAMVMRQLHLPVGLAPVVQVVVAAEVLLVAYGHHTVFQVVPTAATWTTVTHAMSSGIDVANRYAAPVPPSAGLMLVTVGFITLVAIFVDLLAAGLGRAPLAGLALLALYAVPVASLPDGVPAIGFIPGAAAFMSLLMVSERERLSHWGRHVARSTSRDQSEVVDTSSLASTGRRISVFAIAAAVVLPVLVPTFTTNLFNGSGGVGGDGGVSFGNPMVSLASALHRRDPVDLVDVVGSTEPDYLRIAVLDEPRPDAWRNSGIDLGSTVPADGTLPSPDGQSAQVRSHGGAMSIQLLPGFPRDNSVWLPVPYGLTALTLTGFPGEFAFLPGDGTVASRSEGSLSRVSSYLANYLVPEPTQTQLENSGATPADIITRFADVPADVPAIVRDDALRVTSGLSSDYERALALQSFFRDKDNFTYDLNAGYGDGYHAMALFLQKRRGYCQHFAATMAMMARELGIPSRVVVGFLSPSRDHGANDYVFTTDDAHAWPELYFSGVGWVRFEPTPGNGAIPPPYTHQVTVPAITPTKSTPSSTATNLPGGGRNTEELPTTTSAGSAGQQSASSGGGGGAPPIPWLVAVVAVGLALTPGSIRWGIRRSRLARAIDGGESSEYAWLELRDRILDLRLPWTGSLTPRARTRYVEPLLGGDPDGVAALDRLSLTVERARYASSPVADAQPAEDTRQILAAIGRGVDWKQRCMAFLWPASLMPELRGAWGRLRTRMSSRPQLSQP